MSKKKQHCVGVLKKRFSFIFKRVKRFLKINNFIIFIYLMNYFNFFFFLFIKKKNWKKKTVLKSKTSFFV